MHQFNDAAEDKIAFNQNSVSWLLAAIYKRQAQTEDTSATPQTELKDPNVICPSCRQVGHHRLQSKLLFTISCCAAASSAEPTTASAEATSTDAGCTTASATATASATSGTGWGPPGTEDNTGDPPVARSTGWGTAGTGDTPAWPASPCCKANQSALSAPWFLRQLRENKLWPEIGTSQTPTCFLEWMIIIPDKHLLVWSRAPEGTVKDALIGANPPLLEAYAVERMATEDGFASFCVLHWGPAENTQDCIFWQRGRCNRRSLCRWCRQHIAIVRQ